VHIYLSHLANHTSMENIREEETKNVGLSRSCIYQ